MTRASFASVPVTTYEYTVTAEARDFIAVFPNLPNDAVQPVFDAIRYASTPDEETEAQFTVNHVAALVCNLINALAVRGVRRYIVSNTRKGTAYTVTDDNGVWSCECGDWVNRHAPGKSEEGTNCKHIDCVQSGNRSYGVLSFIELTPS